MKSKISVVCECGKDWEDDDTPENAEKWWGIIKLTRPELYEAAVKRGEAQTLEFALRLLWALHSSGRRGKHDAIVNQITTIENEDIENIIKDKQG